MAWLAVLIAGLVLVGCSNGADDVGRARQAIVSPLDASVETSDEAVVAIALRATTCGGPPSIIECTGTLVAPRVVLTAAHCVSDRPSALEVSFGTDAKGGSIAVIGGELDARFDPKTHAFDVAALLLARDAPVRPAPMRKLALPSSAIGAVARIVGFGVGPTTDGAPGRRRAGSVTIAALDAVEGLSLRLLPAPSMTCRGDSGGPVFARLDGVDELIGVTTFGDPACAVEGYAARVDAHLSLVERVLSRAVDGGARKAFAPNEDLCARTCTRDEDCPDETTCVDDGDVRRCSYAGLPPARFGVACTGIACGESACVRVGAACRCLEPCTPLEQPDRDAGVALDAGNRASFRVAGGGCTLGGSATCSGGAWVLILALSWRRRRT